MNEPSRYDWLEHEPDAFAVPFGSRAEAIHFILAPVQSWEHRTRMEMDAHEPNEWFLFNQSTSLVEQISLAVFRAPNGRKDRHASGLNVNERGEALWLWGAAECLRLLDWLWEAFRARLGNRVSKAYAAEGVEEALWVCDDLADRFDVSRLSFGVRLVDGWLVSGEPVPRTQDLSPYSFDFNGYREEAWGRFLSTIDAAKVEARRMDLDHSHTRSGGQAADLPKPDDGLKPKPNTTETWHAPAGAEVEWDGCRPAGSGVCLYFDSALGVIHAPLARVQTQRFSSEVADSRLAEIVAKMDAEVLAEVRAGVTVETHAPRPRRPVGISGYKAPENAAKLCAAFRRNPNRIRSRGRSAFKALREAAGVTEGQERAVKRAIGFEGSGESFEGFLRRLFGASGEAVPE